MYFGLALQFIRDSEPAVHITPSRVLTLYGHPITNSMLYGWACSIIITILLITTAILIRQRPRRGLTQYVEIGAGFITDQIESALGDRQKALVYAPYFAALFFFIMLNNWLGLLPGVGGAFNIGGQPFLRPFTADLNATLAAAVVTMAMVQYFTFKEIGVRASFKHYFGGSLLNPLTWLLGIFEIFSDSTRVISLALRLFLNVAIGEIIISVFSFLGNGLAPLTALPFFILEMFVGALQAYIFVFLAVMYFAVTLQAVREHSKPAPRAFDHPKLAKTA